MQERRAAERLRIDIDTAWESLRSEGRGSVSDISPLGCFVLTGAEVRQGELIRLEIKSEQQPITLWGEVVNTAAEIGFGLCFVFGTEADQVLVTDLIEEFQRD